MKLGNAAQPLAAEEEEVGRCRPVSGPFSQVKCSSWTSRSPARPVGHHERGPNWVNTTVFIAATLRAAEGAVIESFSFLSFPFDCKSLYGRPT